MSINKPPPTLDPGPYWIGVTPSGWTLAYTMRTTRKDCIQEIIGQSPTRSWRQHREYGYRCLQVKLVEVDGKKKKRKAKR